MISPKDVHLRIFEGGVRRMVKLFNLRAMKLQPQKARTVTKMMAKVGSTMSTQLLADGPILTRMSCKLSRPGMSIPK